MKRKKKHTHTHTCNVVYRTVPHLSPTPCGSSASQKKATKKELLLLCGIVRFKNSSLCLDTMRDERVVSLKINSSSPFPPPSPMPEIRAYHIRMDCAERLTNHHHALVETVKRSLATDYTQRQRKQRFEHQRPHRRVLTSGLHTRPLSCLDYEWIRYVV